MLFYYKCHPLIKHAGITSIPSALLNFYKHNTQSLRAKLQAIRQPGYFQNLARQYRPEIIGAAIGGIGGGYLGNQAFNNSLPPVRALPDIQQSPLLEVEKSYGRSN